jgi:hypothetical protein
MALKINLTNEIQNVSLNIGDTAYYIDGSSLASGTDISIASNTTGQEELIKKIGKITDVGSTFITIDSPQLTPPDNAFIMFSKNKIVNNTSLLGYFAEVTLKNNSTAPAELFALNSQVALSSK